MWEGQVGETYLPPCQQIHSLKAPPTLVPRVFESPFLSQVSIFINFFISFVETKFTQSSAHPLKCIIQWRLVFPQS